MRKVTKAQKQKIRYTKILVICHGKCERIFAENIGSNLRIRIKTCDRNKSSIQVDGLLNYMNKSHFTNLNVFKQAYPNIEILKKSPNVKIYIIMDLDDCSKEMQEMFKNKSLFKEHWLFDKIEPIFNVKNLDDVLINAGFEIDPRNKAESYQKVFPGKSGDIDTFKIITEKIKNYEKKSFKTNLSKFLDACIQEYDANLISY